MNTIASDVTSLTVTVFFFKLNLGDAINAPARFTAMSSIEDGNNILCGWIRKDNTHKQSLCWRSDT